MTITEAATSLSKKDHDWSILRSIGVGKDDDEDVIFVYIGQANKYFTELAKTGWCGYPVRLQIIGKIRPAETLDLDDDYREGYEPDDYDCTDDLNSLSNTKYF